MGLGCIFYSWRFQKTLIFNSLGVIVWLTDGFGWVTTTREFCCSAFVALSWMEKYVFKWLEQNRTCCKVLPMTPKGSCISWFVRLFSCSVGQWSPDFSSFMLWLEPPGGRESMFSLWQRLASLSDDADDSRFIKSGLKSSEPWDPPILDT